MADGLRGLKVVELGGGVSAPMAGKLLADLGAEVVKVEPPQGDPARRHAPFPKTIPQAASEPRGEESGGAFLYLNANKRSVTLELETPAGREGLDLLVRRADLVLHNLSPAQMAEAGLDYERLSRLNPALVMVSLTPFGLSGPYKDWVGDELSMLHAGGWGWVCPGKSTPLQLPPLKPFGHHALAQAGLHAAVAALAACRGARLSGCGDHLDVPMRDVIVYLLGRHVAMHPYTGRSDSRRTPVPYEPMNFYPTRDGYIFLICPEEQQWLRLIDLMGNPDWCHDPRFHGRTERRDNAAEIYERLSEWSRGWESEALFHACQKVRVGAAPVFTHAALEQESHLRERGFYVPHAHPTAGHVLMPGAPYTLRDPWWAVRRPAPALGEANGELESLLGGPPPTHSSGLVSQPSRPAPERGAPEQAARQHAVPRQQADGSARPPLPLEGVRVLDLSWVWAGPHCTMMLAALGAEVIKVESSIRPDLTRRAHLYADDVEGLNRCGYYNQINQHKQSVGINLADPEGVALVKALAPHCDVMISNFGTGVLERLGLGVEVMQGLNPGLIMAMISAFGQTGAYRHYTGYGPLISPLAGIATQTGYADGAPRDVGMAYGDPNAGVYAAVAITAALLAREPDAKSAAPESAAPGGVLGQVIDLSMWEAMLCTAYDGWVNHALGHAPYAPMGNRDPVVAPHNVYRCEGDDAWLALAAHDEAQWRSLCAVLQQPELAVDPRFSDAPARKANEDALDALIGAWCAQHTPWEAAHALQAAGVPAFPSLDNEALLEHLERSGSGLLTHFEHPEVGTRTLADVPWTFTRRTKAPGSAAPLLGQHTDAVLQRLLGLSAAQCAALRERGVVE